MKKIILILIIDIGLMFLSAWLYGMYELSILAFICSFLIYSLIPIVGVLVGKIAYKIEDYYDRKRKRRELEKINKK